MKSKKGVAIVEFTFLIFVLLFGLVLVIGSWGVTRSAILHSIAARTYLWHEVNQRNNTLFLKDITKQDNTLGVKLLKENVYRGLGSRFFTITEKDQQSTQKQFLPPKRKMDVGGSDWSDINSPGWLGLDPADKDRKDLYSTTPDELRIRQNKSQGSFNRNQRYKTSIVFLRMGYGICLDSSCEVF